MSGNTIDILFNASGNNDNTKTDQLIKALNNFESILTKFTETSKNYAGGNPNLNNTKTFVNEIQTAIKNSNDKQNSYKASPFPNNTAISGLKNDYRDHLFKNESEQPKFQKDALSRATSEGIKRGVKDSGLESLFKVSIAGFVGKQIVSGVGNYYGYQTQIGSSGLVNPLTSGGNYGTLSANALLASKQQENSLGTTIATIGGGALGAFFGPPGILAGSAIGYGLGSIVSSVSNSTAQLKAQARSDAINQRINNLSLIGTNANVSGLIGQVTGLNGKKLNATTNNPQDLFNPLLPIATEISKGVGTYKRNFEAMDMLTKYAVSANLPLQELSKLGSSAAMLNLNGTQLTNAANLASGAGVGLTDLNIRTLMFQQGGLSIDAAQRAAAGSFSNTGSYQAKEQEFYGGTKLNQITTRLYAQAIGLDADALYNPNSPNHAAQMKKAYAMQNNGIPGAAMIAPLFSQSDFNPNNLSGMGIKSGNARMGVESNIADMLNANQQNKTNALTDKDVANNVTATMSKFTDSVLGSNSSLDGFKSALVEVTSVLQNMQNVGRAFISGGSFMTSGATSSVLDYGNKGAK